MCQVKFLLLLNIELVLNLNSAIIVEEAKVQDNTIIQFQQILQKVSIKFLHFEKIIRGTRLSPEINFDLTLGKVVHILN